MTLEQAILEKVRSLSPDKQQQVLDFASFLVQQTETALEQTILEKLRSLSLGQKRKVLELIEVEINQ